MPLPPVIRKGGKSTKEDLQPQEDADQPIADTFPNCTVLFADVAGFTSWSANHQPSEVFKLLESLYNSFDVIAKRRHVFKVETIGDCYVAATGVPVANKQHAITIARFARECLMACDHIVNTLKSSLGEETATLGMRFGLHSGPVTGGVLRGEKTRFQLFGNTIWIANKIESLGAKGKIHISESCMMHFLDYGKEHWIVEREEKVDLRGTMIQTYWLDFDKKKPNEKPNEKITQESVAKLGLNDSVVLKKPPQYDGPKRDEYGLNDSDLDVELLSELAREFGMETQTGDQAIANLFPHVTLMFGEVDGFVQWSTSKDPSSVFLLLERIYRAFDKIAKRRKIFKVETIADCYVAAVGVPTPRDDHAVAMCRFARECMVAAKQVFEDLKPRLGDSIMDLEMRIGVHSGSVTAGVLRGEKARFQLFGDTMNTTSRMETTGKKGCIQVSEMTAAEVIVAGKHRWLTPRKELVKAKGKGMLQTYWLALARTSDTVTASGARMYNASYGNLSFSGGETSDDEFEDFSDADEEDEEAEKHEHIYALIDTMVDILERLLRKIVAKRGIDKNGFMVAEGPEPVYTPNHERVPLDEVQDLIQFPDNVFQYRISPASVILDDEVLNQLRDFVSVVAYMYRDTNSFHNFSRATFASEHLNKLVARAVVPDRFEYIGISEADEIAARNLQEYCHKLASDPLTQFALIFASLVQDVEHPGVPNSRLSQESSDLAILYNHRCILEQNAIDVTWDLFMAPNYQALREIIYMSQAELDDLRQLFVNCVMATDMDDVELRTNRENRWNMAFAVSQDDLGGDSSSSFQFSMSYLNCDDDMDLKATVLIEYMMQVETIIHTMQPFYVYQKWNQNQFQEAEQAFSSGRSDQDPSLDWYTRELSMFDDHAIPLASKLCEAGLFGYTASEYLMNAKRNRMEWEERGEELIEEYLMNGGK